MHFLCQLVCVDELPGGYPQDHCGYDCSELNKKSLCTSGDSYEEAFRNTCGYKTKVNFQVYCRKSCRNCGIT